MKGKLAVSFVEVLFHAATLAYYGYADYKILETVEDAHVVLGRSADDPELVRWLSGSPMYFTFWNLVLHHLYFTICCLEHISTVFPKFVPIIFLGAARRIRRTILSSLFIPSACLVVVNYWAMSSTIPKMVFADFLEVFPPWVNHSFHTYVVPIAVFELYLRASSEDVSEMGTKRGWMTLGAYMTAYSAATGIYKLTTDSWPYPFFDHMNNWMRASFVGYVYASAWLWYYIGIQLVKNVFGKKTKRRGTTKAKKMS